MSASAFLAYATDFALVLFSLALVLTTFRILIGPTLPDRIVALDLLVGVVIGFIAAFAVRTGFDGYLDIAIALGLVGFLATVALARFVTGRGAAGNDAGAPVGDKPEKTP